MDPTTIALVLVATAAAVLAVLAVPFDVDLDVGRPGRSAVRVGWLFGLVRLRAPGRRRRDEPPKEPKRSKRSVRWLRMIRTPGFGRRVGRLGIGLIRRVRWRAASLRMRVGLEDPADTGMVFGALAPLVRAAPLPSAVEVHCEPAFEGAALDVRCRAGARVYPITLLVPLVAFGLSPATWRAMFAGFPRRGRAETR